VRVGEAMSTDVLVLPPDEVLERAAHVMAERGVQGATVETGQAPPGIITSRDLLVHVAGGGDVRTARVGDHGTKRARAADPGWSLEDAARTMVEGGFRHLVVTEGERTVGMLAVRDVLEAMLARHAPRERPIAIREAMTRDVLMVPRGETIRQTARAMVDRGLGAAIVEPPGRRSPPGMITDRDVMGLGGAGDPASERVAEHLAPSMTFSAPDWSLKQAAEAMLAGDFQHIVVVEPRRIDGTIAMRDLLERWLEEE
jgi:CBS domain-containing protein